MSRIRAPDGINALGQPAKKVSQSRAPFRVSHRGNHLRRFVQKEHDLFFLLRRRGHAPSRCFDAVNFRVGLAAKFRDDVAVHANLSAQDKLLGVTPRSDACA